MARTVRNTAALLAVGMCLGVSSTRASGQRPAAGEVDSLTTSSHIRSASMAIKAAIGYGIQASRTLHNLVAVIDGSDSIVYLAEGDCGKIRRACFVDVTTAGQQRFLPRGGFETMAATDSGIQIREEVHRFERQAKTK